MVDKEQLEKGKVYADVLLPQDKYITGVVRAWKISGSVVNISFENGLLVTAHLSNAVIYSVHSEEEDD